VPKDYRLAGTSKGDPKLVKAFDRVASDMAKANGRIDSLVDQLQALSAEIAELKIASLKLRWWNRPISSFFGGRNA